MKYILIRITIAYILIGLLIGYVSADYYDVGWMKYYYIWDKGKDFLLLLCLALSVNKQLKWVLWSLALFLGVIRVTWQIFAIQDYRTANRPSIIFLLFLLEIGIIVTIIVKGLGIPFIKQYLSSIKKWQKLR